MPAKIHKWADGPVDPVVALTSEMYDHSMEWTNKLEKTFKGGTENILMLQVRFFWKQPPNGVARYRIRISRKVGETWPEIIKDEFVRVVEHGDDNTLPEDPNATQPSPCLNEYTLSIPSQLFMRSDQIVKFRVMAEVGHSGSPVSGIDWYPEQHRYFTAVFERPTLAAVEAHVSTMERSLRDGLRVYGSRVPR